jgi:diguanylate cyclase (GGDEF)-like protein
LVQIFANQAAVAIQNSQLYEMATLDPLSGVYVRRFFEQWLQRELRSAFRTQQPLSLLMMDLDRFKQINDVAGHLAGDQALALIGKVLRQATRAGDIVGRYGGDEFAVILPNTFMDEATRVGQRILEALRDKSVACPTGALPLRSSVGAGMLCPPSLPPATIPRPVPNAYFQEMATRLLQQADSALFIAKHAGGHCTHAAASMIWAPLDENPALWPQASNDGLLQVNN